MHPLFDEFEPRVLRRRTVNRSRSGFSGMLVGSSALAERLPSCGFAVSLRPSLDVWPAWRTNANVASAETIPCPLQVIDCIVRNCRRSSPAAWSFMPHLPGLVALAGRRLARVRRSCSRYDE